MTITYLYAKQHRVTGLRYFGKTTRDPYKYLGSGLHWKRHLKIHGKDIDTTWVQAYTDLSICEEEALFFSKVYNIVDSKEWANVKPENGKDGWPAGIPNKRSVPQSLETRAKKSATLKGTRKSAHFGAANGRYGKIIDAERQAKMQAGRINLAWTEERRAKVAATWALKKEKQEQQ
jgi:hypothetical protein